MSISPPESPAPETGQHAPHHGPHLPRLHLAGAIYFSFASIGIGMVFAFFNAALPLFLESYNLPNWLIGPLANERSFASAIILPVVGVWSDRTRTRFGKRRPFFLGSAPLIGLSLILLGLHPPLVIMLLLVLLVAVFVFTGFGPYQALMADIAPPDQRAEVGSYMALAGMVGAVLANVISAIFWQNHEFLVFLLTAGIAMLTICVTFALVREPAHHFDPLPPREPIKASNIAPRRYAREVMSYKQTMRYIIVLSAYWLAAGGASPFLTLFGTKTLGVEESHAFWLFLVVVISTALGTIPAGRIAQRYGNRVALQGGLAVFTVAAIGGLIVQNVWQALPVMILVGLGNAFPTALSLALLADLMPRARGGEFIGISSAFWSVAQPLGGFIAGFLVDANGGNIRWAFAFAAVMMATSLAGLFFVHPERET